MQVIFEVMLTGLHQKIRVDMDIHYYVNLAGRLKQIAPKQVHQEVRLCIILLYIITVTDAIFYIQQQIKF